MLGAFWSSLGSEDSVNPLWFGEGGFEVISWEWVISSWIEVSIERFNSELNKEERLDPIRN